MDPNRRAKKPLGFFRVAVGELTGIRLAVHVWSASWVVWQASSVTGACRKQAGARAHRDEVGAERQPGGTDAPPIDRMLETAYEAIARHIPAAEHADFARA
jgi:hypothetical protein